MQFQYLNRSHWLGLFLFLIFSMGCSGSHKANYAKLGLIPVTGKITLDGKPLPQAVVFFVQLDNTKSYATTDENGFYRMKFNSQADGVLPGEVVVEISTTARTGEINIDADYGEADPDAPKPKKKPELVPEQYNKKSNLTVSVSSSNREFNFDLKSNGSTTGPS